MFVNYIFNVVSSYIYTNIDTLTYMREFTDFIQMYFVPD